MKNIKKLAFLIIIALGMASCGLFNVDVDTTLSGVLDINVEGSMAKAAEDGIPFHSSDIINPTENQDVADLASRIDGVSVNDITAVVEFLSVAEVVLMAGTTFYMDAVSWPVAEDMTISQGFTFPLANLGSKYDDASAILFNAIENEDTFTVGVDGSSSISGVNFRIRIDIETTLSGSIL